MLAREPFHDRRDFEDAARGFVAGLADGKLVNARGNTVWDLTKYTFLIDGKAASSPPATINPSLYRCAQ
eukprot:COSAG01_NODE_3398_length_6144_cov_24.119438_6_plen_69_part_00